MRIGVGLYAGREGLTVGEEIALTNSRVRTRVTYVIVAAFVLANALTLAGVAYVFRADNANLLAKITTADQRVITSQVVITLLGATTVQLGAFALIMGKYLFPTPGPVVVERIAE